MISYCQITTPIGPLRLVASAQGLHRIEFLAEYPDREPEPHWVEDAESLAEAVQQLQQWFAGARQQFTLPLAASGTPFQQTVWAALRDIPYGQTRSYGELAATVARPTASRAVGAANGRNPLPIVVPCHRVIGADGSLTGFAGGLAIKRWLLAHEAEVIGPLAGLS